MLNCKLSSDLVLNENNIKENINIVKIGNKKNNDLGVRLDSKYLNDGNYIIFTRNNDLWISSIPPNNNTKKKKNNKRKN